MKGITPGSVKVLMLVEAGIIGFLSYWVLSEYVYNAFFRSYADQILTNHVTTYSAVLGLGIGLAGSATAAVLYKNLQSAKRRLETVVTPKFRGAVNKLKPTIPSAEASPTTGLAVESSASANSTQVSQVTAIVPVPAVKEQKERIELS